MADGAKYELYLGLFLCSKYSVSTFSQIEHKSNTVTNPFFYWKKLESQINIFI